MKRSFLTGYAMMAYLAAGAGSEGGSAQSQSRVANNPPQNVSAADDSTQQVDHPVEAGQRTATVANENRPDMTRENAISILNSRKLITGPGKYQVKVTNVTPFQRPDSDILTNIVNYSAMTPYNLQEAKRFFREGDYQGATNQNLSSSQRIGIDFSPMKGEIVEIVLDIIPTKNRPEGALLVIGCMPIRTSTAGQVHFSLEDMIDEDTNRPEYFDPASVAQTNREASIRRAQERGAVAENAEPSLVQEQAPNV